MYLSEKDAEGKWCPFRQSRTGFDNCVGGGCMAWRWLNDQEEHSYELKQLENPPHEWVKPDGEGWFRDSRNGWHRKREHPLGYCGLAEH